MRHGRPRADLAAASEDFAVGVGVCAADVARWPARYRIAVTELLPWELDARERDGKLLRLRAADAVYRDAVLIPGHFAARVREDPFRADHGTAGSESGTLASGLSRYGEVSRCGEASGDSDEEKCKRSFHGSRSLHVGSRGQECSACC